jgi:putative endonuclease
MMGWYVYILRCRDGTLYTGIAVDLRRRLEAHRRGVAAKYTRSRRPVTLAYQEHQPDRSSALKREAALRRLGRTGKLALIRARRLPSGGVHDRRATSSRRTGSRGTSAR